MNVSCPHGIVYYDVQLKVDVLTFTFGEKFFRKLPSIWSIFLSGKVYYNVEGGTNFESLIEILQLKA